MLKGCPKGGVVRISGYRDGICRHCKVNKFLAESRRIMKSFTLALRGHCQEYFHNLPESFTHSVDDGVDLRQIMVQLGINPQLIMGVVVNGKISRKDYCPQEGDSIILLSPPTGG